MTGTPIRAELLAGQKSEGLRLCGFAEDVPVLLVMGGSQGAGVFNQVIRENLPVLAERYQIIHLCGKGNLDQAVKHPRYCQVEYAKEELAHLLAAADYALSRAGANAIFELLALAKPHVLVPLSKKASRGDQILNAASFARQGFSLVIQEEELNLQSLLDNLTRLEENKEQFIAAMQASQVKDGTQNVLRVIEQWQSK